MEVFEILKSTALIILVLVVAGGALYCVVYALLQVAAFVIALVFIFFAELFSSIRITKDINLNVRLEESSSRREEKGAITEETHE